MAGWYGLQQTLDGEAPKKHSCSEEGEFLDQCIFCETEICEKCQSDNAFGHCCKACAKDVENGVISEAGVRRRGLILQWIVYLLKKVGKLLRI